MKKYNQPIVVMVKMAEDVLTTSGFDTNETNYIGDLTAIFEGGWD